MYYIVQPLDIADASQSFSVQGVGLDAGGVGALRRRSPRPLGRLVRRELDELSRSRAPHGPVSGRVRHALVNL